MVYTPITSGGNGGEDSNKEFEHWMKTGHYLWKGVEYTQVPHELEVDTGRGVLYLHNLMMKQTVLRVCRIHDELMRLFASGLISIGIDLKNTTIRRGGPVRGRIMKIAPVFLNLPDFFKPGEGTFSIVDENKHLFFEFRHVPEKNIKDLWKGNFTDITIGVTGR